MHRKSPTYDIFFSYARKDNQPRDEDDGIGWITSFREKLLESHKQYTQRPLNDFFDTERIITNDYWEREIYRGLRTSKIFLAFLSRNYIQSEWCKKEWDEYLRMEHSLSRGSDGLQIIYFVTVPQLFQEDAADEPEPDESTLDKDVQEWIEKQQIQLRERQITHDIPGQPPNPSAYFDLREWYPKGSKVLRDLDAQKALDDIHEIGTLRSKLNGISEQIAWRLDRTILAENADGNIDRYYDHFVGRHRKLRKLHETLLTDKIGLVALVHGMGGMGKSALAIQYSYAYAEFYVSGGQWMVDCAGKSSLAEAIQPLFEDDDLSINAPVRQHNVSISEHSKSVARSFFTQAKAKAIGGVEPAMEQLKHHSNRRSELAKLPAVEPHFLLILDNVDDPRLLEAEQLSLVPREDWLQVIATSRLEPTEFGGNASSIQAIPLDHLPLDDSVALIRGFLGRAFTDGEEDAALEIAAALGGYTVAVEQAAAYLARHKLNSRMTLGGYAKRLKQEGVSIVDRNFDDEKVANMLRNKDNLSLILNWTLDQLADEAVDAIKYASFMNPSYLATDHLRYLVSLDYNRVEDPLITLRANFQVYLCIVEIKDPSNAKILRDVIGDPTSIREKDVQEAIEEILSSEDFSDKALELISQAANKVSSQSEGVPDCWYSDVLEPLFGMRILLEREIRNGNAGQMKSAFLNGAVAESVRSLMADEEITLRERRIKGYSDDSETAAMPALSDDTASMEQLIHQVVASGHYEVFHMAQRDSLNALTSSLKAGKLDEAPYWCGRLERFHEEFEKRALNAEDSVNSKANFAISLSRLGHAQSLCNQFDAAAKTFSQFLDIWEDGSWTSENCDPLVNDPLGEAALVVTSNIFRNAILQFRDDLRSNAGQILDHCHNAMQVAFLFCVRSKFSPSAISVLINTHFEVFKFGLNIGSKQDQLGIMFVLHLGAAGEMCYLCERLHIDLSSESKDLRDVIRKVYLEYKEKNIQVSGGMDAAATHLVLYEHLGGMFRDSGDPNEERKAEVYYQFSLNLGKWMLESKAGQIEPIEHVMSRISNSNGSLK